MPWKRRKKERHKSLFSPKIEENFKIKFPFSRGKCLFKISYILTFDSISFVQMNFPFSLRLIWLYDNKKSSRYSAVKLALWTLIIQGSQSILVGTRTVNGTGNWNLKTLTGYFKRAKLIIYHKNSRIKLSSE